MKIKALFEKDYFEGHYDLVSIENEEVTRQQLEIIRKELPEAKQILDVGCAYGDFLKIAEKSGFRTFGGDISSYALSLARERCQAQFFQFDAQKDNWPFKSNTFDVVTAFDLVEHLSEPQILFRQAYRVLKKNGLFFVSTYNKRGKPFQLMEKYIWRKIFQADETHINVQDYRYWQQALEKAGFKKITIKGISLYGFPPSAALRKKFEEWRLPVFKKIIFSPFPFLWGSLYLLARK